MRVLVVYLRVASDLYCDYWLVVQRVIDALNDLSEAALAKLTQNLVPVAQVITALETIEAFAVVIQRITLILFVRMQ